MVSVQRAEVKNLQMNRQIEHNNFIVLDFACENAAQLNKVNRQKMSVDIAFNSRIVRNVERVCPFVTVANRKLEIQLCMG